MLGVKGGQAFSEPLRGNAPTRCQVSSGVATYCYQDCYAPHRRVDCFRQSLRGGRGGSRIPGPRDGSRRSNCPGDAGRRRVLLARCARNSVDLAEEGILVPPRQNEHERWGRLRCGMTRAGRPFFLLTPPQHPFPSAESNRDGYLCPKHPSSSSRRLRDDLRGIRREQLRRCQH